MPLIQIDRMPSILYKFDELIDFEAKFFANVSPTYSSSSCVAVPIVKKPKQICLFYSKKHVLTSQYDAAWFRLYFFFDGKINIKPFVAKKKN